MDNLLGTAVLLAAALGFPLAITAAARRWRFVRFIGPAVWCYLFGIALANLPGLSLPRGLAELLFGLSIALALPLLLFGSDFVAWVRQTRTALLGFSSAALTAACSVLLWHPVFAEQLSAGWRVSGMLLGAYVGSSANLNAVGYALEADKALLTLVNAAEIAANVPYVLFILLLAKPLLRRVLPRWRAPKAPNQAAAARDARAREVQLIQFGQPTPRSTLAALGAALLCVGLGLAFMFGVQNSLRAQGMPAESAGQFGLIALVLSVTTLGVVGSFVRPLHRLRGAGRLGDYFLLVFSVAFGALVDFSQLDAAAGQVFPFALAALLTAVALHFLVCGLLGVDVDTAIITSAAGVLSTPFISTVCDAIGNRGVLLTGLTTSVVGYAVGNYLGLLAAWLLR